MNRKDVQVQLEKKIKLNDKLSAKDEQTYIQIIEAMVNTNITDKEREALLAIRKELMRKQMTIDRSFRDMNKLNRHIDKKEKEIE